VCAGDRGGGHPDPRNRPDPDPLLTQALNAILLVPLLVFMYGIARDRDLMGDLVNGRALSVAQLAALSLVAASVLGLGASLVS
jgi:Mn2+/Fe2+ NRAMP family transporter